jgi:hypothetical protein
MTATPSPAITNLSEARRARMRAEKPAVHIDQLWRDEIRQRDWARVHTEGDRSPPVSIGRRIWRYTFPTSRKEVAMPNNEPEREVVTDSLSARLEELLARRIAAARMVLGMAALQTRFADRDGEWSLSDLFNSIEAERSTLIAGMEEARGVIEDLHSFVAVMIGRGPEAIIPATIETPGSARRATAGAEGIAKTESPHV